MWLERVPELIEACQDRWSLRVLEPFPQLSYHYVTRAVQSDGTQVVLKLGVPHRDFRMQVEALQAFDGDGCVKLLDADVDLGVVLLESVKPGDMLSDELDDSQPGDWSKRRFQRRGTMRTIDDLAIRTENTWN